MGFARGIVDGRAAAAAALAQRMVEAADTSAAASGAYADASSWRQLESAGRSSAPAFG